MNQPFPPIVRGLNRLRGLIMDLIFPWLYRVILLLISLAIVLFMVQYVWHNFFPPKKILVVLEGGGETLVSQWQTLIKPVKLQNFYEITTPVLPDVFRAKHEDVLEELKITVKGVDLGGIINQLRVWLDPPVYQLHIKTTTEGQKKHFEMRLEYRGKPLKSWYSCSENPQGEEASKDLALFQLLHYLCCDAESPKPFRNSFQPHASFPTPKALAAYYIGLRHLEVYLQFGQQEELKQAIAQFTVLRIEMPAFHGGLMLLGLALTENREEEEAAEVFGSASKEYEKFLKTLKEAAEILQTELVQFQIRLWQATAYRKQYGASTNHEAVKLLELLIKDIRTKKTELQGDFEKFPKEPPPSVQPQELPYRVRGYLTCTRLLALAQCELADTLGTYVVYTSPYAPESLRDVLSEQNTPDSIRVPANTGPDQCREKISEQYQAALKEAKKNLEELRPHWRLLSLGESELAELESLFLVVEGFVQYRLATWTCQTDADYKTECETAMSRLKKANAIRPNHYEILQVLGNILADPVYDPDGYQLTEAKKCLIQSTELKTNDFYGHQELARVLAREVELYAKLDKIDGAVEQAETALTLRPWSAGAYMTLAELKIMKYLLAAKPEDRKPFSIAITSALTQAERLLRKNPRMFWVQQTWEVARFKAEATGSNLDTKTFDIKKTELQGKIAALEKRFKEFPDADKPEVRLFQKKFNDLKEKVNAVTSATVGDLQIYF